MTPPSFPGAKADAARQGASLDPAERGKVEAGEPYTVTVELSLNVEGFLAAVDRIKGQLG